VRARGEFVVSVGDLHGVTPGSVLRVYSPAGEKEKPRLLGHVRVEETRPLDSVVAPVEYDGTPKPADLPASGLCEVVAVEYRVGTLLVGIDAVGTGGDEFKQQVAKALRALPKEDAINFKAVDDVPSAHLVVRRSAAGAELVLASGLRPPIPLPAPDAEPFGPTLADKVRAIQRARSLLAVGGQLERERAKSPGGHDVRVEALSHASRSDPGRVVERPADGWVFRPGDRISFRVTNTSTTKRLEVTLLVVDPDYQILMFHPPRNQVNKALEPGASFQTVAGTVSDKPPFGPESMVVIVTSPTNPPVDYRLLTQPGVASRGYTAKSPVAQLLERNMYGVGSRSGLTVSELDDQAARVLRWRTEPSPKK
jgi:hypothetical protein